jgi:hypothetical protein
LNRQDAKDAKVKGEWNRRGAEVQREKGIGLGGRREFLSFRA